MKSGTTDIIDIDEIQRKEQELLNTIKMEPIIEKAEIEEEELIVKKKKMMKVTDIILVCLIIILSIAFVVALILLK